jgi:hypothetical protein
MQSSSSVTIFDHHPHVSDLQISKAALEKKPSSAQWHMVDCDEIAANHD